jgi:putative oxidoreductase
MPIPIKAPMTAAGLAAGRLLLASLFVIEGWRKLNGYEAAATYMARFGVPSELLPVVIGAELLCGAMIAIGWQTRAAALTLALFCVFAALLFHVNFSVRSELLHFEKDLALAGGLLVLACTGAGPWSIDRS